MMRYQNEIERFLTTHAAAIVRIMEQAYDTAGGHYACLAPDQRRRQTATDAQELTADLLSRAVNQDALQATLQSVTDLAVVNDITRLSSTLEDLVIAFVQQQLPDEPEVAQELITRMTVVSARFRMNLSAAYMTRLTRQPIGPAIPREAP